MDLTNYEKLVLTLSIKHRLNSISHELVMIKSLPPAIREQAEQEYIALTSAGNKLGLDLNDIESLD